MKPILKTWLILLAAPVGYALLMWMLFDLYPFRDFYTLMSVGFFFGVPFGIGYLTIFLSSVETVKSLTYRWST